MTDEKDLTPEERKALYTSALDALDEINEATHAANRKASAIIKHIRGIEKMHERRTTNLGHAPERREGA